MKKHFIESFLTALGYALLFHLLQLFLYRAGMVAHMPSDTSLPAWDTAFYKLIADQGYVADNSSAGFFGLFPLLWRCVGGSVVAGVLLNIFLFASGFGLLHTCYPQTMQNRLLWLSTPAVFFMFVPYAEATCFFFSAVVIYAIVQRQQWLLFAGLVFLSMSRATVIVLLPAMVLMQLVAHDRGDWRSSLKNALLWNVLPLLIGLGVFLWYQYASTGVWFLYFKVQSTAWGHVLSWPKFPLINYGEAQQHNLWLNALAVFTGLFSFVRCLGIAWRWLTRNRREDQVQTLSLAYATLVTFTVLFFNPSMDEHTLCIGINRYMFASPFFLILLVTAVRNLALAKVWHWAFAVVLASGCWLLFGAYVHIQEFLFYSFNTLVVMAYLTYYNKRVQWVAYPLFAFNLLIQIMCYQHFITPLYPD